MRYATYAIKVTNGIVVDAPPIAKWMIGESESHILRWVNTRGGRYEKLK